MRVLVAMETVHVPVVLVYDDPLYFNGLLSAVVVKQVVLSGHHLQSTGNSAKRTTRLTDRFAQNEHKGNNEPEQKKNAKQCA